MNDYEFKGTPAPWQLDENYSSFEDTVITQIEKSGQYDEGWRTVVIEGNADNEHDRHLIAAAPELLEACKKAWEAVPLNKVNEPLLLELKQAIHKALNITN